MLGTVFNILRIARFGGTLARNDALFPVLGALGAHKRTVDLLAFTCRLLRPLGRDGDPDIPPIPRALVALGPAYVKFGQSLATRPDIMGRNLAAALRPLQDRLPPFSENEARETIHNQLGSPVEELFAEFGPPVAAASVAQVHAAVDRRTGNKIAVKILRPEIEVSFRRDISAFRFGARTLQMLHPGSRRLRPEAVVNNFEQVVTAEMNLLLEAAAAAEFGDNIRDEPGFRAAQPVWHLTARRVLTTDWVEGASIDDQEAIRAAGETPEAISARLLQLFLRCALRDGLFHADMHHGNLRIMPDGVVGIVDFGIMGRLDELTRRAYADILYGFLTRDYRRAARAHRDVGYLPADQDLNAFAQALRTLVDPIFGEDASKISMGRVLAQMFAVTERFGMETQTQLLLLQKTMVVTEGVARGLDPHLDIWEVSKPVVQEWIERNVGPKRTLSDLRETVELVGRVSPRLPHIAEKLLIALERDKPKKDVHTPWFGPEFLRGLLMGLVVALLFFVVIG